MTNTAKQENSTENLVGEDIASDDPLFELSRIMGLDDEGEPSAGLDVAADPQIDLEEALLAEMAVEPAPDTTFIDEPIVEAAFDEQVADILPESEEMPIETPPVAPSVAEIEPTPAPTAASLEDELAAMLGGDVAVATQVADNEQIMQEAQAVSDAAGFELEAAEYTPIDEIAEEVSFAADSLVENQPFDEPSFDEPSSETESSQVETPSAAPSVDTVIGNDLDDDFAAFFDNELPDLDIDIQGADDAVAAEETAAPDLDVADIDRPSLATPTLPASEAGFQLAQSTADSISDLEPTASDIEHAHDVVVATPMEPPVKAEATPAPVLETADMSAFETDALDEIDVPDLPDIDSEFEDIFKDELDLGATELSPTETADHGVELGGVAAAGVAAVAAGAATLSSRSGQSAVPNYDDAFDESRFEAELARDMEFVSHDLDVDMEPDDLSLDDSFQNQEFAAAAAQNRPAKRGLVIAATLGCIAIAGAIGVFAFSGSQNAGDGGPVLVEADTEPVKIAPENPGGKPVPNQDRAVFNETADAPSQESLNSAAEEPVDIAAVPGTALPSGIDDGSAQKAEDRLVPDAVDNANASNPAGAVIAPRRVRTLVVRPDGTLVEREAIPTPEPVAPAPEVATAPVPDAPATGGVTFNAPNASEPVVISENAPQASTSNESTVETAGAPQAAAPAVPTRTVRTQPIVAPSQIAQRPADQPVNTVNAPAPARPATNQVAAAAPAPTPAAPAASSPFAVQMASLPTQADAQTSATNLSRRFGNVLGGRGVTIQRAVIDGRGTFYRVRVGANSRADANALCGRIKSAGGDCFVTR